MSAQGAGERLVVIGSSAGGIEALSVLARSLAPDFPAPIVVAQHLDPSHTSYLSEILSRQTPLPVHSVEKAMKLEPGMIYVIPPDRHAHITDHQIATVAADGKGPKPSVDLLFKSASGSYRERCVAVILTGSGSDGTAGAAAVKAAGGRVVIQDPATASFPSMPRSLPPALVDVVAALEDLGAVLLHLVTTDVVPDETNESAIDGILDVVRTTHGIDFNAYKRATILRRLHSRQVATGLPSLGEYAELLADSPDEQQRLVSSFLIKVTSFFRDAKVFTYLQDTVLPDLVDAARSTGELRLWSAGCSTGEEAYSLAILVAEQLANVRERIDVRIFATDADEAALAFARRGAYAKSSIGAVSAKQLAASFDEQDGEFEVIKQIRSMVVFGTHDLSVRPPFPRIDLVMCRNVLIYFTPELQKRALAVFVHSLREGGRLVLGSSESIGPLGTAFSIDDAKLKVFRAHGDRSIASAARPMARHVPVAPQAPDRLSRSIASTIVGRDRHRSATELADAAISDLTVGVVVVDARYRTLRINGSARRMLGIHGQALGDDFVHLAEILPATVLRSAIKRAAAGETVSEVFELVGLDPADDAPRSVEITTSPHQVTRDGEPNHGALLVVLDVTEAERDRLAVDTLTKRLTAAAGQHRRLIESNDDLTRANDTLKLSNEDFLFNAEEAQAGREEMETLAEELQATNEELETLNEELQATNEELETSNEDLATRSGELARERAELEKSGNRLTSVLHGMTDAVLVVDHEGRVVMTNTAYDEIFGGDQSVRLVMDEAGGPLPVEALPRVLAGKARPFWTEFTIVRLDDDKRPLADEDDPARRRWFEATGQAIRIADDHWADVTVIREVTDRSIRRLEERFLARASHELRTPLAAVYGYLQLLVRRLSASPETDQDIRDLGSKAMEQARTMAELVDRLFDLSGMTADRFDVEAAPMDLVAVARSVVDAAAVLAPNSALTLDTSRVSVPVTSDQIRIEQVLFGLLRNAFTHGAAPNIVVKIRLDGRFAVLTVRDDGRGIPVDDQAHLFEAMSELRSGAAGLGLGLFLAREIITAHRGTIELTSQAGRGTTVKIRLPRIVNARSA